MIISYKKRFILLSPWKTASSTCHETLAQYDESPYDRMFHFNKYLNRVVHQHLTLAELMCLPEGQETFFRGAFVRNPYDRAYSGFLQIQRDFSNQPKMQFSEKWIGDLVKAQISRNIKRVIEAEFDFNKWITILPEYEIFEVGTNSNMVLHPAHYWTHVAGSLLVDFVGKVENFNVDFAKFCERCMIDLPQIITANLSEQPLNELPSNGYRYVSLMERNAIDKINALFGADFDYFGYERL